MIVPGGGISLDGTRWVRCKTGFLLPVRVLFRLFRRLFLAVLANAHAAGRLGVFGKIEGLGRREAFAASLAPLMRKNGFVYAQPPFAGPQAVLAYLARYTHRVAISNSRLVALHQALLAPPPTKGVSSHPPLRAAGQPRLQGQHRPRQGADGHPNAGGLAAGSARHSRSGRDARSHPAVPLLRRPTV